MKNTVRNSIAFFSLALALVTFSCKDQGDKTNSSNDSTSAFKGDIQLDVRNSKPDWDPYMRKKAPEGSPNILFILYDDTGLATWSPYGGRVNMPTLDSLAADGLTYTQWHTVALCSPTRSTILTGRNHNLNGMGCITEGSSGFPGFSGQIPDQAATLGHVLQDNGWSTFWLGKNHNVPETDLSSGANKKQWPLQMGFDRFYGFIGGETNQWYPDLVEDNHYIEQPYSPEQGYHFSKDLADQAIKMITDQKSANPSKPWFMWYCPGANHAPHQAPKDYIAKYKGKFDDGYDAYREWVLPRMIAKGILPKDTKLTDFNPMPTDQANSGDFVRPWNTLNADEKKLFSRLCEVFAGYSEYTDAQIGRVIEYLKETGQYENTVIMYAADNGASGEGSPSGSVNENKFFNGYPDELSENMKLIDELGGPNTYEHYPTGWAAAFSTPFKMFKRYSNYSGGTSDPLVITWPKGIKARGEVRNQYHHAVDIVPTILEICGLSMPTTYRGVEQFPLSGVSMKYSFDATPSAPTQKHRQYYAMLGTRAMWEDGWKAVAVHAPLTDKGNFDKDVWELYHVDVDRAEANNLAKKYPEKLAALIKAWDEEADKNNAKPLDDRTTVQILSIVRPREEKPRDVYTYYPHASPIAEAVAANIRGRSYKIVANIEITDANCSGVIFAHGSRFGGHALFIKDHKLYYVYNFLGIKPEQQFISSVPLKPGKYTVGMEFIKEKVGPYHESIGTMKLYINDKVVAQGPMRAQVGSFSLVGDGLCVGYDSGDPVSQLYKSVNAFTGGKIRFVSISVDNSQYTDFEKAAALKLRD
ncbi:arylsulfatase [Cytophaga aurantiaca]|uniref:arylsulfatase n=1 Tax=Cytophaga aurantiaca TaxID=29530 RepID=UPI000370E946|nr:arylsulfatase [Cytophaga aurantiaca]